MTAPFDQSPPPFDQSPALAAQPPIRHGFFGRRGGQSVGVFASNNMSIAAGDDPRNVAWNRMAACHALRPLGGRGLVLLKQTHSTTVHVIADRNLDDKVMEGDAMVSKHHAVLLGILTADCAPVLLADAEAGVVGAFHAGWKGAIGGIAHNTVMAMAALGADPAKIVAAIGPTISLANYEVGPEFAADLLAKHRDAGNRISKPNGGREHFDLPGFVFDQLYGAGVGLVTDLGLCTYAEPKRFFSHRYATHQGTATGRQMALIGLA